MAKYLSDVASGKKNIPQPYDATVGPVPVDVTLPSVALAVGDIITLCDVPPNVTFLDWDILAPQLDSNGTPLLTFSIGEENAAGTDLATVYESGLTFGRGASGSISRALTAAAPQAVRTATRRISLKCTAVAATSASAGKVFTTTLHLRN